MGSNSTGLTTATVRSSPTHQGGLKRSLRASAVRPGAKPPKILVAPRLGLGPAMRRFVGGRAVTKEAASASQMGRFETKGRSASRPDPTPPSWRRRYRGEFKTRGRSSAFRFPSSMLYDPVEISIRRDDRVQDE
ncbi:MAG: hypothetical protein FJX47_02400 [Alphaproteobacteria bacterium]|nr:hypothetical protein [Alphaproteobacteria bacterium]